MAGVDSTHRKLISEETARYLWSHKPNLGGEERPVTTLYAELYNRDDLLDGMQPREEADFLNEFYRMIVPPALRHKGNIDHFAPADVALLATFGVPIFYEDHQLRAARAAIGMRNAVRRWGKDVRSKYHASPRVGIGIYTGHASVGNIGSEVRAEYFAVGGAVDLAVYAARIAGELKYGVMAGGTAYEPSTSTNEIILAEPHLLTNPRNRNEIVTLYPVAGLKKALKAS